MLYISRRGFSGLELLPRATNNECSMYINIENRFLEADGVKGAHAAHPFVDSWSHHASTSDTFREITSPTRLSTRYAVLLVEGNFTTAFQSNPESFDIVITPFLPRHGTKPDKLTKSTTPTHNRKIYYIQPLTNTLRSHGRRP